MGFFDEIGKAMKKVEDEVKKADLDKQFRDLGDGLNKAGSDLSKEIDKNRSPPAAAPAPASPAAPAPTSPKRPHRGYARITRWMKTTYHDKLAGIADPFQKKLELEQISAEATSGLPPKAKKGFLEYLKSQNYEQLLK